MTVGRPTDYTEELAAHICSEIASGRSLRSVAKDEGMPAMSSVFLWLSRHQEFSEQYAKAQLDRTNAFAEEIMEIADEVTGDTQRDKLRVDTRKWLMSKMAPKRFGDKVEQIVRGPDGEDGLPTAIMVTIVDPKHGKP